MACEVTRCRSACASSRWRTSPRRLPRGVRIEQHVAPTLPSACLRTAGARCSIPSSSMRASVWCARDASRCSGRALDDGEAPGAPVEPTRRLQHCWRDAQGGGSSARRSLREVHGIGLNDSLHRPHARLGSAPTSKAEPAVATWRKPHQTRGVDCGHGLATILGTEGRAGGPLDKGGRRTRGASKATRRDVLKAGRRGRGGGGKLLRRGGDGGAERRRAHPPACDGGTSRRRSPWRSVGSR